MFWEVNRELWREKYSTLCARYIKRQKKRLAVSKNDRVEILAKIRQAEVSWCANKETSSETDSETAAN
jgi:hypothetical protein